MKWVQCKVPSLELNKQRRSMELSKSLKKLLPSRLMKSNFRTLVDAKQSIAVNPNQIKRYVSNTVYSNQNPSNFPKINNELNQVKQNHFKSVGDIVTNDYQENIRSIKVEYDQMMNKDQINALLPTIEKVKVDKVTSKSKTHTLFPKLRSSDKKNDLKRNHNDAIKLDVKNVNPSDEIKRSNNQDTMKLEKSFNGKLELNVNQKKNNTALVDNTVSNDLNMKKLKNTKSKMNLVGQSNGQSELNNEHLENQNIIIEDVELNDFEIDVHLGTALPATVDTNLPINPPNTNINQKESQNILSIVDETNAKHNSFPLISTENESTSVPSCNLKSIEATELPKNIANSGVINTPESSMSYSMTLEDSVFEAEVQSSENTSESNSSEFDLNLQMQLQSTPILPYVSSRVSSAAKLRQSNRSLKNDDGFQYRSNDLESIKEPVESNHITSKLNTYTFPTELIKVETVAPIKDCLGVRISVVFPNPNESIVPIRKKAKKKVTIISKEENDAYTREKSSTNELLLHLKNSIPSIPTKAIVGALIGPKNIQKPLIKIEKDESANTILTGTIKPVKTIKRPDLKFKRAPSTNLLHLNTIVSDEKPIPNRIKERFKLKFHSKDQTLKNDVAPRTSTRWTKSEYLRLRENVRVYRMKKELEKTKSKSRSIYKGSGKHYPNPKENANNLTKFKPTMAVDDFHILWSDLSNKDNGISNVKYDNALFTNNTPFLHSNRPIDTSIDQNHGSIERRRCHSVTDQPFALTNFHATGFLPYLALSPLRD
ncbi:hypothetical protein BC833DRAFT_581242 [Globomyces pollinis-pini]|nr:hypothetical protein BC833DRAFT_581242 [Globomyces pollinis-pini]